VSSDFSPGVEHNGLLGRETKIICAPGDLRVDAFEGIGSFELFKGVGLAALGKLESML
jgi:hypothetical protein